MSASNGLGWGFEVGHHTDRDAGTGCTVILPPPGNVASCDIRGSSPGSREIESLHPDKRLTEIHGLLFTGGSAFGLAAADGVMAWLSERSIGYDTSVATVPIVPTVVVFDLGSVSAETRPGPEEGRAACDAAVSTGFETGRVGAGTGCTVGKWAGREHSVPGGIGVSHASDGGATVAAIAVVNALGDVLDSDGSVLAGTTAADPHYRTSRYRSGESVSNTVLAAVVTQANVDKRDARFLAARGSDGITVSVRPAHTRYDGDAVFAVIAPDEDGDPADVDLLGYLATQAVADAVRAAVRDP